MGNMKAILKTTDGQQIPLEGDTFRIGSDRRYCHYVINSPNVSPIHASIENRENHWYIRDEQTLAGIRLNGVKINPQQAVLLKQQDRLEIGSTCLTVIMDLDILNPTDVLTINNLYKYWLLAADPAKQALYKKEMLRIINEKMLPLGISCIGGSVSVESSQRPVQSPQKKGISLSSVSRGSGIVNPVNNINDTVVMEESDDYWEEPKIIDTYEAAPQPQPQSQSKNDTPIDLDLIDTAVLSESLICELERVNRNRDKIPVSTDPFIIGRIERQVNYCLNEVGVSKRHAKIFKNDEGVFCLADLNSKNGTYINGCRLQKGEVIEIRSGDIISFAEYNFTVNIG